MAQSGHAVKGVGNFSSAVGFLNIFANANVPAPAFANAKSLLYARPCQDARLLRARNLSAADCPSTHTQASSVF